MGTLPGVTESTDPSELPDVLYHPDGCGPNGALRFLPTELTRGPWSPDAEHGGPPAALLAGLIADHEPADTRVVRITYELLRPVPLTPLDVTLETIRPGRKVQIIQASLRSGDTEVVRATGLRIRRADLPIEDPHAQAPPPLGEPIDFTLNPDVVMFGNAFACLADLARGEDPGPRMLWFDLRVPVVGGTELTPLQRLAAVADFPNGISRIVPWEDGWIFINPDLTVHVAREPRGEWIGLDARTVAGPDGAGLAEGELYDTDGRVGRSVQSILFDAP